MRGALVFIFLVSCSTFAATVNDDADTLGKNLKYWGGLQMGEQVQTGVNGRDQNLKPNYGVLLGVELLRDSGTWGLTFDGTDQRDSSVAGNISIARERVALGLNLQYAPYFLTNKNWMGYALMGFAYFQDQVQTTLAGQGGLDYSSWQPVGRVGIGVWYTQLWRFRLGAEARLLNSAQYNPQLTEEVLFRIGYSW